MCALVLSGTAQAGYIYWAVSSGVTGIPTWTTAKLMWHCNHNLSSQPAVGDYALTTAFTKKNEGTNVYPNSTDDTTYSTRDDFTGTYNKNNPYTPRDANANYAGEYFWIELCDASGSTVWESLTTTQATLAGLQGQPLWKPISGLQGGESDISAATAAAYWDVMVQGGHVPEPTSGLLVLFGAALLALKRMTRLRQGCGAARGRGTGEEGWVLGEK